MMTKSLYMTGKRWTPYPSATNFCSADPVMHEQHVGVAAAPHVERLAGTQRDHLDVDAAGLLELGQQVAKKPDCSVDVVDAIVMVWAWAPSMERTSGNEQWRAPATGRG
jgi:hypothetical protein